jgi:5-methylcytosine-specific restriction endonuclease McrA
MRSGVGRPDCERAVRSHPLGYGRGSVVLDRQQAPREWLRERLENLPRRVSRPITQPEWLAILDRYGHRCVYCGQYGRLVRDHRMPLALGGANSPENIVPACRSCNQRKHAQHPDRWPMVVEPKA